MRSDKVHRPKKRLTAAERRLLRVEGGPLFEQFAIAEAKLLVSNPELYNRLASMTIRELEVFAAKNL